MTDLTQLPNVDICEVGPRDGLQAEAQFLSTQDKYEFARRLIQAGITTLELTSFVRNDWVPQLGDAEELVRLCQQDPLFTGVNLMALVPNRRGLTTAVDAGITHVSTVVSASEAFAQKNLNATREQAIVRATDVLAQAKDSGLRTRAYISMSFADPWEGPVDKGTVGDIACHLLAAGADIIAISDTIGVATPRQVDELIGGLNDLGVSSNNLAVHFHDTYGQGLANVLTSMLAGIRTVDASAGGLGKCPFAKGATGNLATEDLVWMLHGMGQSTGIDVDRVAETSQWVSNRLGRQRIDSNVARARLALHNTK